MLTHITQVIGFVIESLIKIWPLLLVTIPLSVAIRSIGISDKINSILKKNMVAAIVIATLVGAISPFCSCSVIPVISSLLIAGVPIAPVMSFWLASPSMDPEIFFLSVASVGWSLAVARFAATFIMSLSGGFIAWGLLKGANHFSLLKVEQKAPSLFNVVQADEKAKFDWHTLVTNSVSSIWFVLRFLMVAYLLEALIIFYVPTEVITGIFGKGSIESIFRATLIGVPLYTTNLSALGIIGGLMDKGLGGGAALAFLISGATTTIPAMTAVYKLVHKKVFAIYLGITFGFAILSGILFEIYAIFA